MACAAADQYIGQPDMPLSVYIDVNLHDGPADVGQSSDRWESSLAPPARKAGAMSAWARMRVGHAARALDARWCIVDNAIALDERLAGGHVGRAALHVSKAAGAVSLPSSAGGAAAPPASDTASAWLAAGVARCAWAEFCAGWSDEIDMHVDADQQLHAPAATAEHGHGWDEEGYA